MADSQAQQVDEHYGPEVLRPALEEFDNEHLIKLYALVFDRWNWNSDSEADKEWMDMADSILRERGIDVERGYDMIKQLRGRQGSLKLHSHGGPLNIESKGLEITEPGQTFAHELFKVNNGSLEFGYELAQLLVDRLVDEISIYGSTTSSHGSQSIKSALENTIIGFLTNNASMKGMIEELARKVVEENDVPS